MEISSDIKFDRYGDIEFFGNDISVLRTRQDILYQNVVDRVISNIDDYRTMSDYGANLSGSIGKMNTEDLETEIEDRIMWSLTHDNFLDDSSISINTARNKDKMHVRIDVLGGLLSVHDSFKVMMIYNTQSGMMYATN